MHNRKHEELIVMKDLYYTSLMNNNLMTHHQMNTRKITMARMKCYVVVGFFTDVIINEITSFKTNK